MATGEESPVELERIKFSGISWTHDNQGVFYGCYPDHDSELAKGKDTTSHQDQKLFYYKAHVEEYIKLTVRAEIRDYFINESLDVKEDSKDHSDHLTDENIPSPNVKNIRPALDLSGIIAQQEVKKALKEIFLLPQVWPDFCPPVRNMIMVYVANICCTLICLTHFKFINNTESVFLDLNVIFYIYLQQI